MIDYNQSMIRMIEREREREREKELIST